MFLHLTAVRYLDDYNVEVAFNNGRKGCANLATVLNGPVFAPLRDRTLFAQLRLDEEMETIVWPNGADLAPEFLYFQAFKNEPELAAQFRDWGYLLP